MQTFTFGNLTVTVHDDDSYMVTIPKERAAWLMLVATDPLDADSNVGIAMDTILEDCESLDRLFDRLIPAPADWKERKEAHIKKIREKNANK
jgi:hypothetical protein